MSGGNSMMPDVDKTNDGKEWTPGSKTHLTFVDFFNMRYPSIPHGHWHMEGETLGYALLRFMNTVAEYIDSRLP